MKHVILWGSLMEAIIRWPCPVFSRLFAIIFYFQVVFCSLLIYVFSSYLEQFLPIGSCMDLIGPFIRMLCIHFHLIRLMFLRIILLAATGRTFTFQKNGKVCSLCLLLFIFHLVSHLSHIQIL